MCQITTSCAAQCKNLTNRALELLCLALEAHLARNVEQGVFRDVAVVRDVLHLAHNRSPSRCLSAQSRFILERALMERRFLQNLGRYVSRICEKNSDQNSGRYATIAARRNIRLGLINQPKKRADIRQMRVPFCGHEPAP